MGFDKKQDISFASILGVKALTHDYFKKEDHLRATQAKFQVQTLNKELVFWAENEFERDLWIKSFNRVMDLNSFSLAEQTFNKTFDLKS